MDAILLRLRGWIEACHPFPLAAVVLLTGLIAFASSDDGSADWERLGLVLLAMLLSQLAIGWTNDYVDRDSDRLHQPYKPIASGRLPEHQVPIAIVVVLAGSLAVGFVLGIEPFIFLVIGTGAGLSYDLWLRGTRWSWLPFIVAFSMLPPYVWSALDIFRDELLLIYLVALPLVPAAHIANVLPDLESDRAAGRRNLALIWGRGLTLRILALLLVLPLILTALTVTLVSYDTQTLGVVVLVYLLLLAVAAGTYLARLDSPAFKAVVMASVLFSAGWLAAV